MNINILFAYKLENDIVIGNAVILQDHRNYCRNGENFTVIPRVR